VLLLDDDDTVSSARAACATPSARWRSSTASACGDAVVDKGVTWNVGRTFYGDRRGVQLQPAARGRPPPPGMVNLQQYYLEEYLVKRASELPNHRAALEEQGGRASRLPATCARIEVEAAEGRYALDADWLIAADGARSPIRRQLGLDIEGKVFQDRFLIADVVMKADFPAERWFWFDPPFHPGQSVLLHRRPTTSGASTSSSAGTPTPRRRSSPSA
jgi:3-(3-hydroxy-phenyl)propionate hydroxylase